ncbi:hypothetical protein GGI1_11428 [Acidithiobacillus sp. GGI-221]|nr:hypothetical protein GGI1_11428 [Acidithiobacillus sp. GGI-221]
MGILGTRGTGTENTLDLQHKLAAAFVGGREGVDLVRIGDDLHQTFAVPQVYENDATVVATPLRPAAEGDRLADQAFVNAVTIVCPHAASRMSQQEKGHPTGRPAHNLALRRAPRQ